MKKCHQNIQRPMNQKEEYLEILGDELIIKDIDIMEKYP